MIDMDDRPHLQARILLVDDTALNRDLVGAILRRAGFAVDLATNGETAWEMTWSRRYDLVLMDLEMPGMSGYEAAARIRAREGVMSGVTIAALTATLAPDAELLSAWSGIDAFIAKPVLPARLIERVSLLLGDRHPDVDWVPVWRLQAFNGWIRVLEAPAAAECLDEFEDLLDEVADAIHVHATDSARFLATLAKLRHLGERYGFDELAAICALYRPGEVRVVRSRDPNLLGAIGRARYAMRVWRDDASSRTPEPRRRGIGVRALFGGRQAA